MALLTHLFTKETVLLNAHNTIGRNVAFCNILISGLDVSQSHATLFWTNGHWFLRDHSRNGTLVDGEYIHQGTKRMTKKHVLQFGQELSTKWQLEDLEPPFSYLQSLIVQNRFIKLSTIHALPSEDNPEVTVYFSNEKGTWVVETKDALIVLQHKARIVLFDEEWEFVSNAMVEDTLDYGSMLGRACFVFHLSLDEEYIQLQLVLSEEQVIDLGNRAHNYLLLALARKREEDRQLGLPVDAQGWIELPSLLKDISKEMGKDLDVYYLNLHIFRLRKLLSEVLPFGYLFSNVIERRQGMIRFGHDKLRIVKQHQSKEVPFFNS